MDHRKTWRSIISSCPNTGDLVQEPLRKDAVEPGANALHPVTCVACDGVHFIDRRTGPTLGAERS